MITNKEIGDKQMDACERKDSYIMNRIYQEILSAGTDYSFKEFPRYYHCDIQNEITRTDGKRVKWNTEIKSANLKATRDYPTFKLKEQKAKDAFSVSKDLGLYFVFLDYYTGNAYFYNARQLDWNSIEKKNDRQLIRWVQPELGYDYFPTFFLPKDKAHKIIPFKQYAEEYD